VIIEWATSPFQGFSATLGMTNLSTSRAFVRLLMPICFLNCNQHAAPRFTSLPQSSKVVSRNSSSYRDTRKQQPQQRHPTQLKTEPTTASLLLRAASWRSIAILANVYEPAHGAHAAHQLNNSATKLKSPTCRRCNKSAASFCFSRTAVRTSHH
jgi:hypothetical protein